MEKRRADSSISSPFSNFPFRIYFRLLPLPFLLLLLLFYSTPIFPSFLLVFLKFDHKMEDKQLHCNCMKMKVKRTRVAFIGYTNFVPMSSSQRLIKPSPSSVFFFFFFKQAK
jgi:ABC-type sugar transport system permease subunit